MPKCPNGEKRPADAIGLAVHIGRIATGEVEDVPEDDGKDPAAKALGMQIAPAKGFLWLRPDGIRFSYP
jgi:hypothetical protein